MKSTPLNYYNYRYYFVVAIRSTFLTLKKTRSEYILAQTISQTY